MIDRKDLPDDVVNFLLKQKKVEIQQDGDITVSQACKVWGCAPTTARKWLREMVESGKATEYWGALTNGGHGSFYRIKN